MLLDFSTFGKNDGFPRGKKYCQRKKSGVIKYGKKRDARSPHAKKITLPPMTKVAVINDRENSQKRPFFVIEKMYAGHIRKYQQILIYRATCKTLNKPGIVDT